MRSSRFSPRMVLGLIHILFPLVFLPTMFYVGYVRVDHVHVGEVVEVETLPCGCQNVTFSDGETVRFSSGFGSNEPVPKGWVRIHCTRFGVVREVEQLSESEIESLPSGGHQKLSP